MSANNEDRLGRIELKVDKLSEAFVRFTHIEKTMETLNVTIIALNNRIRDVELKQARAAGSNMWVERVVWAVLAAGLGYLQFKG